MKKLLILLILIIFSKTLWSQTPYFQKYSLLKKNEAVQVYRMFQDHAGFMWYGTNRGLFKFDGLRFLHYTIADSLPDDNVTALAEDSLGRLWMGHRNGKISFFANNSIVQFKSEEGNSNSEISDLLFDKKGHLWFSTRGDGLYYYVKNRLYRLDEEDNLPDLFVYDLMEDNNGSVWAGTDGGVVRCTLKDTSAQIEVFNSDNGLPDNIIKKLALDDKNSIWMATEDNGILEFNPLTKKWISKIKYESHYGTITDFIITKEEVWASTSQLGLLVFDRKNEQTKIYTPRTTPALTSIMSILNDTEGNIWIGTKTGVTRCNGDHIEFIIDLNGSQNSNVLAMTFDQTNALWFSTSDGLFKRTVAEGNATIKNQLVGTKFQQYTIISLYTDPYGYVWAGLFGEGLLRINPQTNKITYLTKELRNGNVLNITGRGNIVWLATLGGGVKITIQGEKLDVKNYTHEDGLISDYIYQVFIDSKDRVWFATDGKGVDMLDTQGFHHFEKDFATKVVYGFVEDSKSAIWANVQGEGLYKFDATNFVPVSETKLRDNSISAFTSTAAGNIIVMNELGIDFINVELNKVTPLTNEVNMTTRKGNLNSIARDRYGRIYFGTDAGVVSCSGEIKNASPKPFIDKLKILNHESLPVNNLTLAYDQNNVTISYHGFWYQNPEELNYKYTLINYDQEWISTGDRSVTYSSLPPGDYTFHVMVSASDDFDNALETTYHFVIKPPFWRTNSFYAGTLMLIVFVGYSYLKFRERKLIRDKRILEEKVVERTREIQMKTEEINAQAEEIRGINENLEMLVQERTRELEKKNKALEESAFIIAHELRAPVASILGLINLISKTELDNKEKEIVNHMSDSAEKLNSIVRTITKAIERGDSFTKSD
ncbi:MAG TPA: two-component regulator propeller domain-containing protein [Cyclobacteriaceae bacterium]